MFRFAAMSLRISILDVRELHIVSLTIIGHKKPKTALTIAFRDSSLREIDLLEFLFCWLSDCKVLGFDAGIEFEGVRFEDLVAIV